MDFWFKSQEITTNVVNGWESLANSIFDSADHPIAPLSLQDLHSTSFSMGKMQRMPS